MKSCQRALCLTLLLCASALDAINAVPIAEPVARPTKSANYVNNDDSATAEEPAKFVVIKEDVIPDVENTTQKVIRVNPLDLPSISDDTSGSSDSSLYKIQTLLPANRNYVNLNRVRRPRPRPMDGAAQVRHVDKDSPIIRHLPTDSEPKPHKARHQQPKQKKQLHFLYNQEALDGSVVSKTMFVHVAPGAYPIYYGISKANGRFGKYPIKGFRSPEEFKKYLLKSKVQPIALRQLS